MTTVSRVVLRRISNDEVQMRDLCVSGLDISKCNAFSEGWSLEHAIGALLMHVDGHQRAPNLQLRTWPIIIGECGAMWWLCVRLCV